MLTWQDLNLTSRNNMLKKLVSQIMKVTFFSSVHTCMAEFSLNIVNKGEWL